VCACVGVCVSYDAAKKDQVLTYNNCCCYNAHSYSSIQGNRNHGFWPSQPVSKQYFEACIEFLYSSVLIYLGVHPNSSQHFLFASFYFPGCYCTWHASFIRRDSFICDMTHSCMREMTHSYAVNHEYVTCRSRSFSVAGFQPRIPSFVWYVPLTPN